jgi:hypothetical protein
MKFTKMSLVAALLIGSSAFAIENVKVSGDAKLYYSTNDTDDNNATTSDGLLNKNNSATQMAVSLGLSADLTKNVSAGTKVTALSTLGLEGQLVKNVWEGTNSTNDSWMVNELWLAGTVGNTTGKIGRMTLDTPLVFTEKWSIVENTFESAVVINKDIPDTTIVATYIGGSNGTYGNANPAATVGIANVIATTNNETTFTQFHKGAYAVGAINNSIKPLTLQAWYFDATHTLSAFWLQADLDAADLGAKGLTAGAQYTDLDYNNAATKDSSAYALMLGYEMKDMFTAKVAYSSVDKDNGAGFNLSGKKQSKLYTEAQWGTNFGYVTAADTDAYKVSVTSPVQGMFDLGLFYTSSTTKRTGNTDLDMTEFTLTAGKDFGPLNATVAYIYTDADNQNDNTADSIDNGSDFNTVNVYLTYNF